jgi:hypothetical protein
MQGRGNPALVYFGGLKMSYNGWTNRATWMVNLWVGDTLADDAQNFEVTPDDVESMVQEMLPQDVQSVEGGLAADLMAYALADVNWRELAEAANEGVAENA